MAFSDIDIAKIEKVVGGFCRQHNRPEFKNELSLEFQVKRQGVIVCERRPSQCYRPPRRRDMVQHEYRQFTEASVDGALRLVERRESEGWEFAGMFPKPHGVLVPGRDFEVVVILRRRATAPSLDAAKPTD